MDISPQTIRSTGFKTVKKGYDPDEVESFRTQVAAAVETAQNQAAAMEARARAAVAKLQEVSQQAAGNPREAAASSHSGDTDMISRTLLLAQRTADATVMEARTEADGITAQARDEASRVLDSARTMAVKTVEDSRLETRRAVEDERVRAENEVQSLLARRDFLLGDVDHLEQYLQAQRDRVRDAAVQLQELVDRVPGGMGEMRRPLLSASAEPLPGSATAAATTAAVVAPAVVQTAAPAAQRLDATSDDDDDADATSDNDATSDDDATFDDDDADADANDDAADADGIFETRDAHEVVADLAPSRLSPQVTDRAAGLSALAMSGDTDAQDDVWRLLDEEVASTQAAQVSLELGDATAQVPVTPAFVEKKDPFRLGGNERQ